MSPSPGCSCAPCAFSPNSLVQPAIGYAAKRTRGQSRRQSEKIKGLAFWTLAMWRDNQAIRTFGLLRLTEKRCRSCRTGATKPRLPTRNRTVLIGRPGKPPLEYWRSAVAWLSCSIHRSNNRRAGLKFVACDRIWICSSRSKRSIVFLSSSGYRWLPFNRSTTEE